MKRIIATVLLWLILGLLFALLLTACQSRDGYFGRVKKPTARRLILENFLEPSTLDPQLMLTSREAFIADTLFDSLIRLHPITLEPTADIATHYKRNPEATRYVFYLRGHPQPRGIRLPNTDDLRDQFRAGKIAEDLARGHSAPPDSIPACWSDGRPVTAHDFVYSWQRLFDPKTAAPAATQFPYILNSAEILAGVDAGAGLSGAHRAAGAQRPDRRVGAGLCPHGTFQGAARMARDRGPRATRRVVAGSLVFGIGAGGSADRRGGGGVNVRHPWRGSLLY